MDSEDEMLRETYRLSKENNRMLHAMRRNAFWGGVVKIIVYALLLGLPIWLYLQYLLPVLNQISGTMNKVQGTSAQLQTNWTEMFDSFKKQFSPQQ